MVICGKSFLFFPSMVNGDFVNGQLWMMKIWSSCCFSSTMQTQPAHYQFSVNQFSVKNTASPFSVPSIWMVDCFFSWPAVNHLVVITIADYLSSTLSVIRYQLTSYQLIISYSTLPSPFHSSDCNWKLTFLLITPSIFGFNCSRYCWLIEFPTITVSIIPESMPLA